MGKNEKAEIFLSAMSFQILFMMGQLYTRLSGGIMKKDINVDYDTYGFEGERDYAIDNNCEYQPSYYDEMYEVDNHMSTRETRRPQVWITWWI